MKTYLVVLSFLLSLSSYSQDLKVKKKSTQYAKEIYQVDKQSKQKNGYYYQLALPNKDTLVTGQYFNDNKVGEWSYRDRHGQRFYTFNYDTHTITNTCNPEAIDDSTFILKNGEFVLDKVNMAQLYLGYKNEPILYLARNLKLPMDLVENNISGICMYALHIDENGKLKDIATRVSLHKAFDQIVKKAVNELDGNWIPAQINGQSTASNTLLILRVNYPPTDSPKSNAYQWNITLNYSGYTTRRIQ